MGRNYRLIRTDQDNEPCYAVHEVYYRRGTDQPENWSAEPDGVLSDDRMGVLEVLARMADAIRRPVLEERDGKLVEVEPERVFSDELIARLGAIMMARESPPPLCSACGQPAAPPSPPGSGPRR